MPSPTLVRHLPLDNGSLVKATITEMTPELAEEWHLAYQPAINATSRADRGWSWPRIRGRFYWLSEQLGQDPIAYCLGVPDNANNFSPVGMLLLAGRYPALNNHSDESVFAWFLAAAPEDLMHNRISRRPRKVGRALIDAALTHSCIMGHDGRTGLHAHPKGGAQLMDYYQKSVGLQQLPALTPLPRVRRLLGNDGRYFYADEPTAHRILVKMDGFR